MDATQIVAVRTPSRALRLYLVNGGSGTTGSDGAVWVSTAGAGGPWKALPLPGLGNDKTPTYASDPHGWLANPALAGRESGEQQLGAFLATGQLAPTNPAWLETPIADPNNLECLHYPDPQTGQQPNRQPYPTSGDCPPAPSHGTPVAHTAVSSGTTSGSSRDDGGSASGGDNQTAAPRSASAGGAPSAAASHGNSNAPATVASRPAAASLLAPATSGAGALLLAGAVGGGLWRRRRRSRR